MIKNQMEKKIMWLKVSYLAGAILDLVVGIAMLFPKLTEFLWQLETPIQGAELIWTKYFGVVALAWTSLLLWAMQKPIERKGTLVLSIFPILIGMIGIEVYAIVNNLSPSLNLWLFIVAQTALVILFSYSLYNVRNYTDTKK
jgi:hypothetical protein